VQKKHPVLGLLGDRGLQSLKKCSRFTPSKPALLQAALLESLIRTTRAEIVSSQFFFEQFVSVDDANTSLDLCFGWKSHAPFTHPLEKMAVG
jgi:hypothetical protein